MTTTHQHPVTVKALEALKRRFAKDEILIDYYVRKVVDLESKKQQVQNEAYWEPDFDDEEETEEGS